MSEAVIVGEDKKSVDPVELFGVSDRYQFVKVLGQGAYGIVWYAERSGLESK